ncbi:MAG: hypothetical protein AABY03_01435 [Nanoarchaeota archaeon]
MDHELIHVKFKYSEALEGKRELLTLQQSFLKTADKIGKFNSLRSEEMKTKLRLQKKMRETSEILKTFKKMLPEAKVPHLKKEELKFSVEKPAKEEVQKKVEIKEKPKTIESRAIKSKTKTEYASDDLESQIREIQEKLNSLQ